MDAFFDLFSAHHLHELVASGLKACILIAVAMIIQWLILIAIRAVKKKALARAQKNPTIAVPGADLLLRSKHQSERNDRQRKLDIARQTSRITTLAGVARSAASIVLWCWALIGVAAAFHINVRPLLASAGVAGLAIGFGAKSLIQDIISGMFMLIEEQYGVGDWIEVNDISGTVESISLRITTVRDIDGTLWYIRNGQITSVGNSTKGFAVSRIEVPIGLSNDIDRAKSIVVEAANEAIEDPSIAECVLGTVTMDGVSKVDVDHMTIRACVKTIPGEQWRINREIMAKVLERLSNAGITTPYPNGIGIPRPDSSDNEATKTPSVVEDDE